MDDELRLVHEADLAIISLGMREFNAGYFINLIQQRILPLRKTANALDKKFRAAIMWNCEKEETNSSTSDLNN